MSICKTAETVFRTYSKNIAFSKRDRNMLILKLKTNIELSILNEMECVPNDSNLRFDLLQLETHRDYLINIIGHKYFDIRTFHEIRKTNDSIIKIRQKLTKIIHFRND